MRRFLTLFTMLMLSGVLAFSQGRLITGTVTDNNGNPVPYASVKVKNSKSGVSANADGNFSISVPEGSSLIFSGINLTPQEVTVGSQTVINPSLVRSAAELNTVVVTAYGIRRQAREVGYSTATVSGNDLNQAKVINPVTGLIGKVSGLQIQTTDNSINPQVRVTLRGNRSILGNNQALIIVDGIQVDNSYLARLNANDIESTNILKGASASAIYGSNASNGVIVVTTRRGTKGKPRISFSSTVQMETISYLPDLQYRFGSYGGEGYGSLLAVHFPNDPVKEYYPYENQSYGPEYNGEMVPLGGPVRIYNADGTFFDSTRMVKYSPLKNSKRDFFDKGVTYQNNVSFSTGDETSLLYLSFQNVSVHGTIPKDKAMRNNFRLNGMKTYGNFRVDYNTSFAIEKNDQVGSSGNYDQGGYPLYWEVLNQPAHADLRMFRNWKTDPFANPNGYFNAYYGNPWWYIDENRDVTTNNNFIGDVRLSYQLTTWLNASYTIGYSRNDRAFKNTVGGFTFDPYTITDPWEAGAIPSSVKLLQPSVTDLISYRKRISADALLTANKNFGNFSAKLILGNSISKSQFRYVSDASTSLVIPGIYNINYRQGEPTVDEQYTAEGLIGVFGDLTLGYRNFLFLHGTARNDWNSKLAKNNRSIFYPSGDLSLVFTEAIPALRGNKTLSYGKVHAAYTRVGQVSIDPYQLDNIVTSGAGFPFGAQAGFTLGNDFKNAGLKPEFSTEREVGIELGFMENRINFQANYFSTKTTNQTIPSQISAATGFTSATINLGSMTNKGIELDLKLTPFLNLGPVKWNVGATFSYIKNKVGEDLGGEISLGNSVYAIPGKPYPYIKVSDWTRDSLTGKIIVDSKTGYPTKAGALTAIGTSLAPYKAGITTSFTFKGLTLSAVADAQFGGLINNSIGSSLDFTGVSANSAQAGRQPFVIPNTVVDNGSGKFVPNTSVATIDGNWTFWANTWNRTDITYVNSSDYWKIREIALTYDFSKLIGRLRGIQALSLTISGRNLFMFRAKDNIWTDPEYSTGLVNANGLLNNAIGKTDYYQTPPTRIYGATLNVTF